MSNKSYNYNPIPPRVWSRVQNPCTYIIPGSDYTQSFIPLTDQVVSQAEANKEMKMFYKGNILQYKGNSARLSKSQKYSQLARCAGPNRTKVFATQSETYTNPNTTGLLRVGFTTYPYPNQIVGVPNNISGPFAYNVPNPNDCSDNSVQDGGILVCGTYANPCSNQIYKQGTTTDTICNESAASNVPGSEILCWNKKIQTWFPKPRYFMNNSTDKWHVNYKGFVSAVKPPSPILNGSSNCGKITLNWSVQNNSCIPITSFNIYINNVLLTNVSFNINSYSLDLPNGIYKFYIESLSQSIKSDKSNEIVIDTDITIYQPINLNATLILNNITLNWTVANQNCLIGFNIYLDGIYITSVSATTFNYTYSSLAWNGTYTLGVQTQYYSGISPISSIIKSFFSTTGTIVTQGTSSPYYYILFTSNGSITFYTTINNTSGSVIGIAGGGGGAAGGNIGGISNGGTVGGGGAGGGYGQISSLNFTPSDVWTFTIGSGGNGGSNSYNASGGTGSATNVSNLTNTISCTGGGGGGAGGTQGSVTINGVGPTFDGGNGNGGSASLTLTIPPELTSIFTSKYGGGGGAGGGNPSTSGNGGTAGSNGNGGSMGSAGGKNGQSASTYGSGGGGGGSTGGFESFEIVNTGGSGKQGMVGFWWST